MICYREKLQDTVRGVCRVPCEIMINEYGIRIWLGQGDGKLISIDDLKKYAKATREWADLMDQLVEEAKEYVK